MKSIILKLSLILCAGLLVVACKEDGPEYPSVVGTSWEYHIKWVNNPDTAIDYYLFNAGGGGQQVTSTGIPTGEVFSWSQNNDRIAWNYASVIFLDGNISLDGNKMTGTGTYGANTSGWRAVKQ